MVTESVAAVPGMVVANGDWSVTPGADHALDGRGHVWPPTVTSTVAVRGEHTSVRGEHTSVLGEHTSVSGEPESVDPGPVKPAKLLGHRDAGLRGRRGVAVPEKFDGFVRSSPSAGVAVSVASPNVAVTVFAPEGRSVMGCRNSCRSRRQTCRIRRTSRAPRRRAPRRRAPRSSCLISGRYNVRVRCYRKNRDILALWLLSSATGPKVSNFEIFSFAAQRCIGCYWWQRHTAARAN